MDKRKTAHQNVDWAQGACRTSSDTLDELVAATGKTHITQVMYPRVTAGKIVDPDEHLERAGKYVCAMCPILFECREYAITYEDFGTWGGLNELERKKKRKELSRNP